MNLKIGTINFWGGSTLLVKNKSRRFEDLASLIKKEEFDILALQEVWSKADAKRLAEIFEDYNFYFEKGIFSNKFGLVLMSRFKIKNRAVNKFPRKFSWSGFFRKFVFKESFFAKGYQMCTLDDMGLTVINAHFYYSVDKRQLDLEKLFGKNLKRGNMVICGDFNCDYTNIDLPTGFEFVSDVDEPTLSSKNPYSNTWFNKFHFDAWTCDLLIANLKTRKFEGRTIKKPLVSDHFLASTVVEV